LNDVSGQLLWFVPALPLAAFVILALAGPRLPKRAIAIIGAGAAGLAAVMALVVGWSFLGDILHRHAGDSGDAVAIGSTLYAWFHVGDFAPMIAFRLDGLSAVFMLVVTVVGFLIILYSSESMREDEGYSRFLAYMNLFVAAMLTLVLADNLLLLYLGWEGVGLCSFLLIGFWYTDAKNGRAARKAFIVTRIGDTAMMLGLLLIFTHFGVLNIQDVLARAQVDEAWLHSPWLSGLGAALLLGGAVGKSAQLPLQVWLPDAMAGPTPTSALIHAATMVTAGVYLIARTHVLFELAPNVQLAVAVIGAATLLIAGFSALTQRDIKRVLAYSTISQIGYMFLALGVGAWSAGIFHFFTHAMFKSLLFLAAGAVIMAMHEEHDMFKMGGLWRRMPLVFWTFLIGSASLAALPLVTAGYYSKDAILAGALAAPRGGGILWSAGWVGAVLTAVYTTRMVVLTFFGPPKKEPGYKPGLAMSIPLVVLAGLSIIAGVLNTPRFLGNVNVVGDVLRGVLPATNEQGASHGLETLAAIAAAAAPILGVAIGYWFYVLRREAAFAIAFSPWGGTLRRFFFEGWGFDKLYQRLFVNPILWFARVNRADFIDSAVEGVAAIVRGGNVLLSLTQTGKLRWYAMGIVAGAILVLAIVVCT
jgi:NADH-quinone oxidoreductase subunit L